jgi:hypothetical protein
MSLGKRKERRILPAKICYTICNKKIKNKVAIKT